MMIESVEQLTFEGMKPIDKKMKKAVFREVKALLKTYHKSKIKLEDLLLQKQAMNHQDESLEGEIRHFTLFIERVELALKACSDVQREILNLGCITSNPLYDKEVKNHLNIRGNETWDREKTGAYFNFASIYGIHA